MVSFGVIQSPAWLFRSPGLWGLCQWQPGGLCSPSLKDWAVTPRAEPVHQNPVLYVYVFTGLCVTEKGCMQRHITIDTVSIKATEVLSLRRKATAPEGYCRRLPHATNGLLH